MERILTFLKDAKTYYLGTINAGKPDIRPFGTINIYKEHLYIQTGKKKKVYEQMINNPNISICAMNSNGKWIRIKATALEDKDINAEIDMLSKYPELQSMYQAGDGNNVVFRLENVEATIYSFVDNPINIKC